jgi:hypothetical protein
LIPKPAYWWLDFYRDFRTHLETRYQYLVRDEETCMILQVAKANV